MSSTESSFHLNEEQLARVEALKAARELLRLATGSSFTSSGSVSEPGDQAFALRDLAEYILKGDEPTPASQQPDPEPTDEELFGVGDKFGRVIQFEDGRKLRLVTSVEEFGE